MPRDEAQLAPVRSGQETRTTPRARGASRTCFPLSGTLWGNLAMPMARRVVCIF